MSDGLTGREGPELAAPEQGGDQVAEKDRPGSRRWGERGFWLAIALLATVTVLALAAAIYRAGVVDRKEAAAQMTRELDLGLPAIEALVAYAESVAVEATLPIVGKALEPVFQPVHAAVPAYADFHYSVLGEYTELTQAALGRVGGEMEQRLFGGFDARLHEALERIEAEFTSNMNSEVARTLEDRRASEGEGTVLSQATMIGVSDALARIKIAAPIETIAVIGAAKIGARAASTTISKAVLKVIVKLSAKTAVKPVGVGAGAAGGAVIGSFGGPPGAFIGGAIGGTIAWFGIDFAVLKIDELLNRETFELELHAMIDSEQERVRAAISDFLQRRGGLEGGKTIREMRDAR